jgi:hydrogenase maturation protein HypF
MVKRARGVLRGVVQGVGFRPFVYQLARRYGLTGYVVNTAQGVHLEVEGPGETVEVFFRSLPLEKPPLAYIESLEQTEIPPERGTSFEIRESREGEERFALISPDVGVCPDCLAELKDPLDRRYGYPFINCTHCGPRYTIILDIPYDRRNTTMDRFRMCPACRKEYEDPRDRRFHAQPNACWDCGPVVSLHERGGDPLACSDPIQEAILLLQEGSILAVKGLGGFHLVVDAANHQSVLRLRKRKHREEKPLAVMVRDLDQAREIAHVGKLEAETLTSRRRPILLLRKRRSHGLSPAVSPKNQTFGIMLPYTPLHVLLMEGPFKALVMTSGNRSEEPISIDHPHALKALGSLADYFLSHDRDIHLRSDDSVLRVIDGLPRQIRRSRGYVPMPIFLRKDLAELPPVAALGAGLKNTLCFTKENRAFMSQHIGDMENLETYEFFLLTLSHLKRILEIEPRLLAHDLHPDYLSSAYALGQRERPAFPVQHHHAHIVSCLAEANSLGPAIGIALDGTGLGEDGRIWGGEVLLSDLTSYRRVAHLEYVALPGGDAAARSPWRMAVVYLEKAFGEGLFDLPIPFVKKLDPEKASNILRMAHREINSPLTSSCGRLFDGVSSLLGIRDRNAYEGQAAVELEMAQCRRETGSYPWEEEKKEGRRVLLTSRIVRGVVQDLIEEVPRGVVSRRFHNTLVLMFADLSARLRDETGVNQVALSGGVFQNASLMKGLSRLLKSKGFTVLTHSKVPTNDGGLALGQAVCAGLKFAGYKGQFEEKG